MLLDLSSTSWIPTVAAICLIVLATLFDLRTTRIPNMLTLPAALAAIGLWAYSAGFQGLGASIGGLVLCGLVPALLFKLSWVGGGDVKLIGALGAILGPMAGLELLLIATVAALVWVGSKWAWRGVLFATLWNAIRAGATPILPKSMQTAADADLRASIRFAPALLVGVAIFTLMRIPVGVLLS